MRARLIEEDSESIGLSEHVERPLALNALKDRLLLAENSHLKGETLGIVFKALIQNVLILLHSLFFLFATETLILGTLVGAITCWCHLFLEVFNEVTSLLFSYHPDNSLFLLLRVNLFLVLFLFFLSE